MDTFIEIILAMPPWSKTEVYTGNFGLFVGCFRHPYKLVSLEKVEEGYEIVIRKKQTS
ncbi:MAG: hypothetical protein GY771_03655 [bacterium]|nr:hypothetical protein [bacterium]